MKSVELKSLKQGEWFTKKAIDEPNGGQVWIRGEYDRELKKYCCYCWGDVNKYCFISGTKAVYIDFTF